MHILGYFILVFGVIGIMLGLYGLLMPIARRRGITFTMPRLRLPMPSTPAVHSELDDVLADLESSGFRNSPFDPPRPLETGGPRVVRVPSVMAAAAAPASPSPVAPPVAAPALALDDEEEDVLADVDLEGLDEGFEVLEEEQAEAPEDATVVEASSEEASEETPTEETPVQETPPEEAAAGESGGLDSEMMALFGEAEVKSKTPEALREAIPVVTMQELLADARELRKLLAGTESSHSNAA